MKRRADIGKVLEALGIQAKRHHDYWEARCPSHQDRSPSWSIVDDGSEKHGLHLCRACDFRGNLSSLVMHVKQYAAWSSVYEFLDPFMQEDHGPLPTLIRVVRPMELGFKPPSEAIWDPLHCWVTGAQRYAISRGLTPEQVTRWGIGYAVDGRLAGRILFPLRDHSDRLLNYQARIFAGEGPRYLTPKEEDLPDYDAVFGERYWPSAVERRGRRIVVWEGAIKALAYERALPGEPFAVLGGSNVRPMHAAKLATFGEVVIATDKDRSGNKASMILSSQLSRHTEVKRVILPRDPDEMSPGEVRELFRCVPKTG